MSSPRAVHKVSSQTGDARRTDLDEYVKVALLQNCDEWLSALKVAHRQTEKAGLCAADYVRFIDPF